MKKILRKFRNDLNKGQSASFLQSSPFTSKGYSFKKIFPAMNLIGLEELFFQMGLLIKGENCNCLTMQIF